MAGILKVDRVQSDSNLAFQVASSNVAYINSTGLNITGGEIIAGGSTLRTTSGLIYANSGIAFPATQNPSADANTLDDYEEGTWTAYLSDGTNSVSMGTFAYTKVGKIVLVKIGVYNASMTTLSGATHLRITGFPFPMNSSYASDGVMVGSLTSNNPILLNGVGGSSYALLYHTTSGGAGVQPLVKGDFGSTTNFSLWGNFTYLTN